MLDLRRHHLPSHRSQISNRPLRTLNQSALIYFVRNLRGRLADAKRDWPSPIRMTG